VLGGRNSRGKRRRSGELRWFASARKDEQEKSKKELVDGKEINAFR